MIETIQTIEELEKPELVNEALPDKVKTEFFQEEVEEEEAPFAV